MAERVHVLVEIQTTRGWDHWTNGRLEDVKWELEGLAPNDLAAITALEPGGQLVVNTTAGPRRITRLDGWTIHCTAWKLLGTWSFVVDTTHEIVLVGGRVAYHAAEVSRDQQRVLLTRLAVSPLRIVRRYVAADAPVLLRPISRDATAAGTVT